MDIEAKHLDFKELNQQIKLSQEDICIQGCYGQRFIGSGLKDKKITIHGTPGNALGAYLDGGEINVYGNAQEAVGDTMNAGKILIHGNAGDALGYAMRGGCIYVQGNAGYRTGIHMKEFENKKPAIIVGGRAGSFLGEYLAGGLIIVLGIGFEDLIPIGSFTGTGMHGGKIFIRTNHALKDLPPQVTVEIASNADLQEIESYLLNFSAYFDIDTASFINEQFYVLIPNAKNPYKKLYTVN